MRVIVRVSTALLLVLACTTWAWGAVVTCTWTGGAADNLWTTAGNWTPSRPGYGNPILLNDTTLNGGVPSTILVGATMPFGTDGTDNGLKITTSHDITFAKSGSGAAMQINSNSTVTIDPADGLGHTYIFASSPCPTAVNGHSDPTFDVRGSSVMVMDGGSVNLGPTSFTKKGTGTLRLGDATNPTWYFGVMAGGCNIQAGVLELKTGGLWSGASTTVNSWVNISSGATVWCENGSNSSGHWVSFKGNGQIVLNTALDHTGTVKTLTGYATTYAPGDVGTSGLLSIYGNVGFTLPNWSGTGCPTACTMNVDITGSGTTAGTDFDQLAISGTVQSYDSALHLLTNPLASCDLVVNGTGAVEGNSYTFLTSGNSLAAATFKSVTVNNTALPYTVAPIAGDLGYQIAFTPEPATMSLLVLGGLAMLKRRML